MSPLHAYLDLERLASAQDEFKIEIGGPSLALSISSSARSDGQASSCSFDFSAAYDLPHPHNLQAYADEIFHNGQIRPQCYPLLLRPIPTALCPDLLVRHCAQHLAHEPATCSDAQGPDSPHLLPHSSEIRTPAPPLCPDHKSPSNTAHRRRLSSFLHKKVSHADDEGCFPLTKALNAASRAGMPSLELQEMACSPQCQPHGKPRLRRARTFGPASASRHSSTHAAFSCNPHRTQSDMAKTTFLPYRKGILACIRC